MDTNTAIWAAIVVLVIVFCREDIRKIISRISELEIFGVKFKFLKNELEKDESEKESSEKSKGYTINNDQLVRRAIRLSSIIKGSAILIINDEPWRMSRVVKILRQLGGIVDERETTKNALVAMKKTSYDVIISDMKRGDEDKEGQSFLEKAIDLKINRPTIFMVGAFKPELGVPPYAFGITNRIDHLLNLVFDVLERTRG